jgi:hypothetical protein
MGVCDANAQSARSEAKGGNADVLVAASKRDPTA